MCIRHAFNSFCRSFACLLTEILLTKATLACFGCYCYCCCFVHILDSLSRLVTPRTQINTCVWNYTVHFFVWHTVIDRFRKLMKMFNCLHYTRLKFILIRIVDKNQSEVMLWKQTVFSLQNRLDWTFWNRFSISLKVKSTQRIERECWCEWKKKLWQ